MDRRAVRAKFRCMSVERSWDDNFTVRLRPVSAGTSQQYEESEENLSFWRATPNGEMTLIYVKEYPPGIEFKPNHTYYLDFVPTDDEKTHGAKNWEMTKTIHYKAGTEYAFSLRYGTGPQRGDLSFSIDNGVTDAADAFGSPRDGLWRIELTPEDAG